MKQYNFGILSTSSIADRFVAALKESGVGRALAICSRKIKRAEKKAKELGIERYYGDYQSLVSDDDIDIVYVSTVNSEHYRWAREAILNGKHVLCEKPCTTSSENTLELYELAQNRGVFFMEAQKMLFLPVWKRIKEIMASGELGEVRSFCASHSFPVSYNGWMLDKSLGGGPLLSSGIYAAELILWLFGDVDRLSAVFDLDGGEVERGYHISGITRSKVLFTFQNSTLVRLDDKAQIFCEKGSITVENYWKAKSFTVKTQKGEEDFCFDCDHELIYEILHFTDCIEMGLKESPIVTKKLSCDGIRLLEKAKSQM